MFNGDIRKERVERVMVMASQLTLAEMKAVVRALTHLHDSIVMERDPKWVKAEAYERDVLARDPNWEGHL